MGRRRTLSVHLTPAAAAREDDEMGLALVPPHPPLTSDDFLLRPFGAHDVGAIVASGDDPEIVRHTFMPEHPTTAAARDWLERAITGWAQGEARFAIVACDDPTDQCLGQIGLALQDHPRGNGEAFYWLLPQARGRGWAGKALRLVSCWGFAALGVERVFVLIEPDNGPSIDAARSAGFEPEGILRGYEHLPGRGRLDLWSWSFLASDVEH